MKKNEHKLGVRVNKDDWEMFKNICKSMDTDSSKEIRKFIKRYIKENRNNSSFFNGINETTI